MVPSGRWASGGGFGGELHGGGEESLSAKEGEESKVRGDKEEGDEIELETVCWVVMVVEIPQRGTDVKIATKGNGDARVSEEECLVF